MPNFRKPSAAWRETPNDEHGRISQHHRPSGSLRLSGGAVNRLGVSSLNRCGHENYKLPRREVKRTQRAHGSGASPRLVGGSQRPPCISAARGPLFGRRRSESVGRNPLRRVPDAEQRGEDAAAADYQRRCPRRASTCQPTRALRRKRGREMRTPERDLPQEDDRRSSSFLRVSRWMVTRGFRSAEVAGR